MTPRVVWLQERVETWHNTICTSDNKVNPPFRLYRKNTGLQRDINQKEGEERGRVEGVCAKRHDLTKKHFVFGDWLDV